MMKKSFVVAALAGAAGIIAVATAPADASVVIPFTQAVTNNDPGNVSVGLSQMTVEVIDAGSGMVDFTFRNQGPIASSITDLYWQDGTLLALSWIVSGPGTSFSEGAAPPNLPGGQNAVPPFIATVGFSADSDPPAQINGVNPGQFVTVRFTLQSGGTYDDVVDDLATGALRIGIHVQGFASGGSESFINELVPSPSSAALLGLLGLAAARRRR